MKLQLLFFIQMLALTQGPWLSGSEEESGGGSSHLISGVRGVLKSSMRCLARVRRVKCWSPGWGQSCCDGGEQVMNCSFLYLLLSSSWDIDMVSFQHWEECEVDDEDQGAKWKFQCETYGPSGEVLQQSEHDCRYRWRSLTWASVFVLHLNFQATSEKISSVVRNITSKYRSLLFTLSEGMLTFSRCVFVCPVKQIKLWKVYAGGSLTWRRI